MFGSNPPGRCSRHLFLICYMLSIQPHGSKGTLNFPPLSPLCAVRNEADPHGSRFDYDLSLLSLSMVTEGLIPGRQDAIKQISKRTLFFCCNFMHRLYTEVLLNFNCWVIVRSVSQQPRLHSALCVCAQAVDNYQETTLHINPNTK